MSKNLDQVVYDRVAALIKRGWSGDALARNAKGRSVSPYSKTAVRFCAVGALARAAADVFGDETLADRFLDRAIKGHGHCSPDEMRRIIEMKAARSKVVPT